MRLGTRRTANPLLLLALALAVACLALGGALAVGADNPGTVVYDNATYTAPPSCETMLVPAVNPDIPVRLCAIVRRPESGGGLYLATFFTIDGTLATIDLRAYGYEDCFGASVWPSPFSATVKAIVNCKVNGAANGNDRAFFAIDTGIAGYPPGP